MSVRLLREYIQEVLTGFGNPEYGKDGVAGNLFPTGVATGDAGVRPTAHDSTDNEADEEEQEDAQGKKLAACCLIMTGDGHVLAVSRKDDPTMLGFPGGKVDDGEEPIQAAARELEEETGLVATKLSPVFVMGDKDGFTTYTFACEVDGEIDTPESGVIRWVRPSVLADQSSSPFVDYNRALFTKLGIKF